MSATSFTVTIRGIRENPAVTEINVRSGPNTSYTLLFKVAVGTANLPVLDARQDDQNANLQGKTYQWLQVMFPNGQTGWVRDDLIDIQGDGRRFGYPVVNTGTIAFAFTRTVNPTAVAPVGVISPSNSQPPPGLSSPTVLPAPVTAPPAPLPAAPAPVVAQPATPVPSVPAAPAPTTPPAPIAAPTPGALDRVRRAAFAITAAFEGGGYATYQTYDSGIISYGRFQFTLSSGSLMTVVNRYLSRANSPAADGLRSYLPRLNNKEEALRQDPTIKQHFINAASDPIMQQIQDEVATEGYWGGVIDLSIAPRNIQSALGYALIFDMAIQHGRFNHLLPKAETELNVPPKSRVGENGVSEQTFITKVAQLRRDNLYALAEKLKLPGMRNRGDFWVNVVGTGDWNLQGDSNGNLNINGKIVQVRNP